MKRYTTLSFLLVFPLICCSCFNKPVESSLAETTFETVVVTEQTIESETMSETTLISEVAETEEQVIGDNITYNNSFGFTNSTGRTITALYVKTFDEENFDDVNLIDEPFLDGEVRQFYIEVGGNIYDIEVVYDDGTVNDINDVFLGYISEASLVTENDLTSIEYVLTEAGQAAVNAYETAAVNTEETAS